MLSILSPRQQCTNNANPNQQKLPFGSHCFYIPPNSSGKRAMAPFMPVLYHKHIIDAGHNKSDPHQVIRLNPFSCSTDHHDAIPYHAQPSDTTTLNAYSCNIVQTLLLCQKNKHSINTLRNHNCGKNWWPQKSVAMYGRTPRIFRLRTALRRHGYSSAQLTRIQRS